MRKWPGVKDSARTLANDGKAARNAVGAAATAVDAGVGNGVALVNTVAGAVAEGRAGRRAFSFEAFHISAVCYCEPLAAAHPDSYMVDDEASQLHLSAPRLPSYIHSATNLVIFHQNISQRR